MLNTPIENKASNVSSYDVYKLTRVIITNTPLDTMFYIHYTKKGQ